VAEGFPDAYMTGRVLDDDNDEKRRGLRTGVALGQGGLGKAMTTKKG
jgi:hypothetical protein